MRLFHVSEESNISIFEPRTPAREDLDKNVKLVWSINEDRLINFLTPRDCPRVTFYAMEDSIKDDIHKFIGKNLGNFGTLTKCTLEPKILLLHHNSYLLNSYVTLTDVFLIRLMYFF